MPDRQSRLDAFCAGSGVPERTLAGAVLAAQETYAKRIIALSDRGVESWVQFRRGLAGCGKKIVSHSTVV